MLELTRSGSDFDPGRMEAVKLRLAQANVHAIAETVWLYMVETRARTVPTVDELCSIPADGHRPWLEISPFDPWGQKYWILVSGRPAPCEVISAGPDGVFGSADDVSSARIPRKKR